MVVVSEMVLVTDFSLVSVEENDHCMLIEMLSENTSGIPQLMDSIKETG